MLENLCKNCFEKTNHMPCPHCGYRGTENEDKEILPINTILNGKYIIGKNLGRGGFGITYLALDLNLNMKVCIKEYFPGNISTRSRDTSKIVPYSGDAMAHYNMGKERFVDEGKTLARFNSLSSTTTIHDFFYENNTGYLVMEYLNGMDLAALLKSRPNRKLSAKELMKIMLPIMDVLIEVHQAGLIHRDISPDNIFITKSNNPKLLDFGSARYAMGEESKSLSVILKHGYAPPEQYSSRGKQGPWTDIYALCATMYKCLTGTSPVESIERMTGEELVPIERYNNNVPANVSMAITKGLSLDYTARHQSVIELKHELTHKTTNKAPEKKIAPRPVTPPAAKPPYPGKPTPKNTAGITNGKYLRGLYEYKHGKYRQAYILFSKAGDFEDSRQYVQMSLDKLSVGPAKVIFLFIIGFIVLLFGLTESSLYAYLGMIVFNSFILCLISSRGSVIDIAIKKQQNIISFLIISMACIWPFSPRIDYIFGNLDILVVLLHLATLGTISFFIKNTKAQKALQWIFLAISIATSLIVLS